MRSATLIASGNDTRAVSVARLTVAETPSSLFSFFSTRATHDAQVMPPMTRTALPMRPTTYSRSSFYQLSAPTGLLSGRDQVSRAVGARQGVRAGLVEGGRDRRRRERGVAGHGDRRLAAGDERHGDRADARHVLQLAGHRVHAVLAGHAGHLVRRGCHRTRAPFRAAVAAART